MMQENEIIDSSKLELASKRKRIQAFVIDDILISMITLLILWDQIALVEGDLINVLMVMNEAFVQILFLKLIYQTFFVWYYGATIGKIILKIKVIKEDDFGRVDFVSALMRSASRIVSESIFYLGFVLAYYTEGRQTLHDKLAKTLVVNG
jgi:uncharacterized RDD family membrane protein YckC